MSPSTTDCYICENNSQVGSLPVREEILTEGDWRVAHAFDTSLPGWLVLVPGRHVSSLADLTLDEARLMGELLQRCSSALQRVLACTKTYVMLFAEQQGFGHLHLHVVPRMADFTPDQMGPRVFTFLGKPAGERLATEEQDAVSLALREVLAAPVAGVVA